MCLNPLIVVKKSWGTLDVLSLGALCTLVLSPGFFYRTISKIWPGINSMYMQSECVYKNRKILLAKLANARISPISLHCMSVSVLSEYISTCTQCSVTICTLVLGMVMIIIKQVKLDNCTAELKFTTQPLSNYPKYQL